MSETLDEKVIILRSDVDHLEIDVKDIKQNYVIRIEFDPIKKIVYGLVGIILTAVVVALISLIIR